MTAGIENTSIEKTSGAKRTAGRLFIAAVAMFGFGYALVPLYNVYCELTGLNGKTGAISEQQAAAGVIDTDRLVTVEFDTNINGDLPWEFRAGARKVQVHPGKITDVFFMVENKSDRPVVGRAIPSVAPAQASLYFNKTECFCFTEQTLAPGERREMLVRFVVDSALPEKITTLTLSYTFFGVLPQDQVSASATDTGNILRI
jgi:Cytochrome oxidase assembly factor